MPDVARASNFRSSFCCNHSNARSCRNVHRETIQEVFQRRFTRKMGRAVRAEPVLPKPDAHRPALAANLPAPRILLAAASGYDDIERSAR
jgi:hypothetical protein